MSLPLTLIVFGASGDLTARKLIPSLFQLHCKKRLPAEFRFLGTSRSPMSDDAFRDRLLPALREQVKDDWNPTEWEAFAQRIHYFAADGTNPGPIDERLRSLEGGPGRRIYYLSVSPTLYQPIVQALGQAGMTRERDGAWRRIIIEKPFGHDLASARELNASVAKHFDESQIYRIDHYLGKETVQNILVFRFANTLFEPLWNNTYIDHVQITVSEAVKVGSRGDYYDGSGVMRDMIQNHLLMLLTFVAMEGPARFEAHSLRNEKLKVLESITVPQVSEAAGMLAVGQYEGYRSEKGVAPDSRTPTFAAVELHVDNWRWRGVPFYLRSGKAMRRRLSEIVVQFRCPPHLMFPLPPGKELQCNRLSIQIQPEEGIHINFQTKVPDTPTTELRPMDLSFRYGEAYPTHPIPEAYERLLLDAIHGDAALFMRSDEIERAWAILDPFLAAAGQMQPETYAVGSEGPAGANALLERGGREWVSLCK